MKGIIVLWSGAIVDIPSGWHLCDGTQGTPDLRDMFVIGAGDTFAPDDSDLGIPTSYVDRGAASASDWVVGDFTTDDAWHDLDVSSVVPAGASAIHFAFMVRDNLVGVYAGIRGKAHPSEWNRVFLLSQVANILIGIDCIVACDNPPVIQYKFSATAFTSIYLIVRGWWIGTMEVPDDTVGYYALAYIMKI